MQMQSPGVIGRKDRYMAEYEEYEEIRKALRVTPVYSESSRWMPRGQGVSWRKQAAPTVKTLRKHTPEERAAIHRAAQAFPGRTTTRAEVDDAIYDSENHSSGALGVAMGRSHLGRISKGLADGMDHHQARQQVKLYGDRGPLPSTLTREQRMKAYQGRYIHAGGEKLDHYTSRANLSDKGRITALGAGTAAGAASLALRSKSGAKLARAAAKKVPKLRHVSRETAMHHSDLAAGGAAVAGGANELYGDYQRKKRADASSTPAGIAAGALRRMKAYTPDSS